MSKIRFGILGSGYMGRTHAEAVLQLGDRADTAFLETRMQAYRDQASSFIGRIHGEPAASELPCVGTGHDGRAAVAACRAILTSSAQRRWVDLTPGATLSATQK